MNNKEVLDKINTIQNPSKNFLMFQTHDNGCYFGKDQEGNVVYMIHSRVPNIPAVNQETRSLRFIFNKKCVFECDNVESLKTMHVLTCKERDQEKIKAFIRLTQSFSITETGSDEYYLAKLFSYISALFDKQRHISETELQGLFSELYSILFLYKAGCDVSKYWQTQNRMKFDFSFGLTKRMEIKSTLKTERFHHFRHDQLLSELYDIRIVSILLRKSDGGISLAEVVDQIREIYSDNFPLMYHIDSLISQIDEDYLYSIKYDVPHLDYNIRFYNAKDIPHFNEKNPDGVFNTEYDCSLDNIASINIEDIISWIEEEEDV